MATGKVTKRTVDALKAGPKDQFLWDEETRGFGVKATPAGNKVFVLQYRLGGRGFPVRRYTIGDYGHWTPDQARDKAKALRKLVDDGIDPVAEKTARVQAATEFTVNSLADRFITAVLQRKWKKSHKLAERSLRNHVLPRLGKKPIANVKESDIEDVLNAIPEKQKGARRNTYALMHRFFVWAVKQRDIPLAVSPLVNVEPPEAPDERERTLAEWELRLAWLAAGEMAYPFGQVYRLLIGTGQRREEVAGLDWRELNRGAAEWALPSTRAKNGVANAIHLTPLMIAEFDAIAGGAKWPRQGLVFTTTGSTPVSGHSRAKTRLDKTMLEIARKEAKAAGEDREAIRIEPFVAHDFRRTMATGMQRLGFRWEAIEACENRISGRSRKGAGAIYQRHDWGPEKKLAWEAWSKHIEQAVACSDETNVVQIAEARA